MSNENDYARIVLPGTLEITRTLPASPEVVWKYLVDPELRQLWFCAGETGSAPGEPFTMDFDHTRISDQPAPEGGCGDPMVMHGTIVEFEPHQRLTYDWPGPDKMTTSRVSIQLFADGENTRLELKHSSLGSVEFQRGASAGWHTHLDLLVDLSRGDKPRDFWKHYNQTKEEYDRLITT